MGTLAAQVIVDRAKTLLNDTDNVRWTSAEAPLWISDAQREVVFYRPEAFSKNQSLACVAGTKQTIPSDGIVLLDVVRNVGGRAVRQTSREVLDAVNPNWHTATATASAIHFIFNPVDRKNFYIYPASTGVSHSLEIIYSASPPEISNLATAITVDDIYANAMVSYFLFRAYSKDATYAGNANLAGAYYTQFVNAITSKAALDSARDPGVSPSAMLNPNMPGSRASV